jgi:hypothetical protein
MMLIWTVLTIEIISILSDYLQYDLLQTGNGVNFLKLPLAMTYIKIIAIIYLVTYIISGITLSDGFGAYFNLHLKQTLSFTEGWAAGCWFVPFISLYRPKQIMNELYVETQNLLTTKQENSMVNLNTQFIRWWWAYG